MNKYDFFYGEEADQFDFFRIPKALMKGERFTGMDTEAKILYGLMLDRMGLSRKNGWLDEEQRVYIIYTNEQVRKDINCSVQKAVRYLKQLEEYNLIFRRRRGQGRASLIYVMNYARSIDETDTSDRETIQEEKVIDHVLSATTLVEENIYPSNNEISENPQMESLKEQNARGDVLKYAGAENRKFKRFQNGNSRDSKIESLDFPKWNLSNTDINNTNMSDSIYPSIYTEAHCEEKRIDRHIMRPKKENINWEEVVKDQIDYTRLKEEAPYDGRIDEIVSIMVEVLSASGEFKIKGRCYPCVIVHSQFRKLNMEHIKYVLSCINRVTERIRNIHSYLITALFTASSTMSNYYSAMVSADMNSGMLECAGKKDKGASGFITPKTFCEESPNTAG